MDYDVIVVGGGPAGSANSYFNAKKGKKVLLIDKSTFPRDKICGDGITGKALTILHEMGLTNEIEGIKEISSTGVLVVSPKMDNLRISIESPHDPFSAFSIDRYIIDNLMFQQAKTEVLRRGGEVLHEKVVEVIAEGGKVVGVKTDKNEYRANLIVGAGGYNCPISKYVLKENGLPKQNRSHYSSALREYWEGLEGNDGDFEIHFIDGILPGYFWIFPISETKFNVGVGMLLSDMDNQSVKLKEMLRYIVNESYLKDRFKNATLVEGTTKGWLLPLGSPRDKGLQPRKNFVDGCMLIGDSASLIDPFTGEGIGNALTSGKLLADYDSIDSESGVEYQKALWDLIGKELSNSHRLQRMLNRKWLINRFIKKASKNEKLQNVITDMLHNKESQDAFASKWFILKSLIL
jgi:geranylgeranyl reductase family protein